MTDELRIERGPFVIIPEWMLDADVSDGAFRLYATLAKYADNETGECFPARSTLAKRRRCSTDTIDRRMAELVELGAVDRAPRRSERGDQTTNLYRVRWYRTGAEGGSTDAAGSPQERGDGGRADAAQNLTQENETQGTTDGASAPLPPERALLNAWWESFSPRPTQNYVGAAKIVKAKLRAGWSEGQVRVALARVVPPLSDGKLETELRRRDAGRTDRVDPGAWEG